MTPINIFKGKKVQALKSEKKYISPLNFKFIFLSFT